MSLARASATDKGVALWLGQFVHEIDQRQRDFEQAGERHVSIAANSRCPQHLHLPRALFCVREQRALPGACFAANHEQAAIEAAGTLHDGVDLTTRCVAPDEIPLTVTGPEALHAGCPSLWHVTDLRTRTAARSSGASNGYRSGVHHDPLGATQGGG